MNSKITAFLEKFCVKESNNLIDPENFEAKRFSIMGSTPAISQKWTFLLIPYQMHKTNLITQLILEIILTHCL